MAVETIDDLLLRESGRFATDILHRTLQVSPFLSLVEEGAFPEGMGYSIAITQFGRTMPAASNTYTDGAAVLNPAYNSSYWTDIGSANLANGSENNCTPPTLLLKQGTSKVNFNLQHLALESERFCATDLLSAFDGPRQFSAIKKNLSDNTRWVLTEKFRRDFTYWCDNKTVVNGASSNPITVTTGVGVSSGVAGADTFNITGSALKTGAQAYGGVLTMGMLQQIYTTLVLNGAGDGALVKDNNAPVFQLICSMDTSIRLKRETGFRDDFHWSNRADELLKQIGLTTPPVLGFQHVIDVVPPRWNYTNGAWVRVEPYYIVAGGNTGFMLKENPDYLTAGWEDSFVFHKDVMKECYPGSVGNTNGTGFQPLNYRGTWGWRNIPSEDKNPDGQTGYFRGVFMLGAMPEYTNYGWCVRHARCGGTALYAACV